MQIEIPRYRYLAILLATMAAHTALSNNIQVRNVTTREMNVDNQTVQIVADISWENSWHNDLNWDAAWIFVKFRAPDSSTWEHAALSTVSEDHQPAADGMIVPASDGSGIFLHRHPDSSPYAGTVEYPRTRLLWTYGTNGYEFASGDLVDIAVHAIEMVYVPEGSFYLGSGGTEGRRFHAGGEGASEPFLVDAAWNGPLDSTDDARRTGDTQGRLWASADIQGGTFGDGYPTGYGAFYCMKYPVTQGQYADFLNSLSSTQAANRYSGQYGVSRHIIAFESGVYTAAEAPDRICNWLTSVDSLAYADWSGLRPMTELEFEKACRGFAAPEPDEYAWGTGVISQMTAGERDPELDGTGREMAPVNRNATAGLERAGITAANATTRTEAGASYWGIMDLTSYTTLGAVSAGNQTGRDFNGAHGNGVLTAAGATTIAWPGLSARNSGWNLGGGNQRVSVRESATQGIGTTRKENFGFRAVRTAP